MCIYIYKSQIVSFFYPQLPQHGSLNPPLFGLSLLFFGPSPLEVLDLPASGVML